MLTGLSLHLEAEEEKSRVLLLLTIRRRCRDTGCINVCDKGAQFIVTLWNPGVVVAEENRHN